ncbi:MAG: O-antigen/teichoic acid export membrane protein [Neolewinella sp.]|jgi:O-antigen/teichoic acid export membrane protein
MHSNLIRAGQFAQGARQGAIILVALALPRLGVGREVIGEWESLLYVGYILGFGWLTGLLQGYLVRIRLTRPKEAALFSRIAVVGVAVFSGLLLAIAAGLHVPLFRLLRLGDAPPGWWYFFLFLLTQWPGLFFEQVLMVRGKARALAIFGGFSALGFTLALLIPLYYGAGLAHALFVLAIFAAIKGLVILGWVGLNYWLKVPPHERSEQPTAAKAEGRLPIYQPILSRWLSTSWPLMAYATVGALVTAFDPWFVNYWYEGDESIFATFRYGARELPLLAAITNGAMVVVLPRLTEDPSAGLDLLKESSRRLFHWIFGGAILLMATSPWWWTLVFTEVFAESLPLFRLYLFIVISRLMFPMPIIVALGFTRRLYLFSLSELLMNIAFSLLLTPYWGLLGIIASTVLADILNKVILIVFLQKKSGINFKRYMEIKVFGIYLVILVACYLFF